MSTHKTYENQIYHRIEIDISALQTPTVLGVNGVDASGKTSFAIGLGAYFQRKGIPTTVIHLDDFHNPRSMRSIDDSPEGYIKYAFNLSQMHSLILKLKNGPVKTTVCLLDLDSDAYVNNKLFEADRNTVIIVEGVLLYRPPLNALFDYRIFLDVTFEETLRRARGRDVPKYGEAFLQRYIERYIPAQKIYLSVYSPKEISQLVIDNNDYSKPFIKGV